MAQGVLEQRLHEEGLAHLVAVDSAGTHAYHRGEPPDARAMAAARARGIDISGQRARLFRDADYLEFDLILAMDDDNLARLERACPPRLRDKVRLALDFAPELSEREVPDPYYGEGDGFEKVLDMLELCMEALIDELHDRLEGRVAL